MMDLSVKVHDLFIVVLLLWRFLDSTFQAVTSETNISTICNTTNNTWAMLSCSSNSWYHVIQELYSPVNSNCLLNITNNTLQENSDSELNVSCVGPVSPANSNVCGESVKRSVKNYNETFVQVTYECINESKMYKLGIKHEVKLEDEVYLASPLMFATSEQKLFNGCLCEITNVSKAEVLYADVENSNLNITCGTWTRDEFLFLPTIVNIDLVFVTKPCTMTIIYRDDNRSDSSPKGRVWIKVSGSNMTLNCNEQLPAVSTPSTTATGTMSFTKTSLTTSLTSQESSPDSTTSQPVSSTTQSTSTTSQPVSSTTQSTSTSLQQVSSTTQSTSTPSQQVSSTTQSTSTSLQQVSSTTQSTSTSLQQVSSTTQSTSTSLQQVSSTTQSTSTPSQQVSSTTQSTSTSLQQVSSTTQSTSTSLQQVSSTTQSTSTPSQQVSSTTQSTSTTSQQVSTTLKPTSSTSHPVYSTTKSTSTTSQPVSTTLQTTSSTSQSTSTILQPVSSTTQSTSSTFRDISAISQSTRITPIYLIVPIVVGGVALITTVVAVLAVRTKCCQTRARTRDRYNCGGLGEEVPALEDKDNRLSTHSCDVYVDLDDVSITPLPDSTALCPATIQNGVSGPEGSDVIMFDNVAYVSGSDIISKRDVTQGDDRDSDEVLMVDNVVYEPSAPVGTIKTFQNEKTGGADDNKDEVMMVDNVVYSSSQSTSPV